ncbi:MAG: enoyl-CoA hydratase/isomerase family protein [Bacteroidetes bacterium]|nr:enoyl-CoA hydratase/isomerase family protein [Bacteroidota bacterium]
MALITYHCEQRIGYITLNRPEKRNALNSEMVTELKAAFKQADDDPNCKVIVLKAIGQAFSAGADLGYLQTLQQNTFEENYADSTHLKELFEQIYFHNKVVIAQVEGHAIAGGCGLATVCDFVYSVPDAMFGYTEVKIGFVPAIVMFFLLRKINEKRAKDLLLSGRLISANQAAEMELINHVISADEISNAVEGFATQLIEQCSADSLQLTKRMIGEIQTLPPQAALDYAAKSNAGARETADCKKGIAAFLNKEKINW